MNISPYQLVVLDIDGTLLQPDGSLSPRTIEAVHAVGAMGVTIVLATSRRWRGAAPIAQQLDITGPLILYDGALISQFPQRQTVARFALNAALSQQIVMTLAAQGWQPVVQYANARHEFLAITKGTFDMPSWSSLYLEQNVQQIRIRPLESLCVGHSAPLRIVVFGPPAELQPLLPALARFSVQATILPRGSYGTGELTVAHKDVSKGTALATLAAHLHIPLAQTLAIGDEVNDCSMLASAGLGIAMGQSRAEVRAAAKVVTGSNSEDGVAQALATYVLQDDHAPPLYHERMIDGHDVRE